MMRGFQIWSQNLVWIIFDPYSGRRKNKKNEIAVLVYFDGFSAAIRVKYYSNSILRPYFCFALWEGSHFGPSGPWQGYDKDKGGDVGSGRNGRRPGELIPVWPGYSAP